MEKRNLRVAREDIEVVDGKVVISSEELAAAIQQYDVDLNAEEENSAVDKGTNIICVGC